MVGKLPLEFIMSWSHGIRVVGLNVLCFPGLCRSAVLYDVHLCSARSSALTIVVVMGDIV